MLDPGDYFEAHFLVATNVDKEIFQNIIHVDGLITGNVRVSVRQLRDMESTRFIVFVLSAMVVFGGIFALAGALHDRYVATIKYFPKPPNPSATLASALVYLIMSVSVATLVGWAIGCYFVNAPVWLERSYLPRPAVAAPLAPGSV